jgi:hypothetical protein
MRLGLCASMVPVSVDQMIARAVALVSSLECIVQPKLLPEACVRTSDARPVNEIATAAVPMVKGLLSTSPLMLLDTE